MEQGDCFQANAEYLIDIFHKHPKDRKVLQIFRLCHGMVLGAKGSPVEGKWFMHCWIEINGDVVLDNSNGKQTIGRKDKIAYRIKEETVKRYTVRQAMQKLLETEHYGEWD